MKPTSPSSSPEQEYPYGWRYVKRARPDGSVDFDQVPLTLEDVLHPQEGDVIPESKPHEADRRYLACVIEARLGQLSPRFALLTSDLIVLWSVEGLRGHSPDVGVFVGLSREPDPRMTSFDQGDYGGWCELAIELVSPRTRDNDVFKKRDHYHTAGVRLYVIVDQYEEGGTRCLKAFRRKEGWYDEVNLDGQGRVRVAALNLAIGLRDNRVVCFDLTTGEEIEDYLGQVRGREEERRAREKDRQQFDQFKEETEQAMTEHVQARQAAEGQAVKDRLEADKQRQEVEKQRLAREAAEDQAEKQRLEAEKQRLARDAADQRVKDLEEMLRRLQTACGDPAAPPQA
jgi:Uma2 family endonuclease